jgi:tetratricopeptide (TPR) repeat protein
MPRIHPKPEVFEGLLRFFPEERDRLRRYVARDLGPRKEEGGRRILSWRSSGAEYEEAIEGVLDRFRPRMEDVVREMAEAPFLLAELLGHPPVMRELLARNDPHFRSLALCRLLLDRSYEESAAGNPQQGERLAEAALAITESLDPARYGGRVLADARARAWIAVADARRADGDLWGSERALKTAEEHLRKGMRDCLEKAQLLHCKACLRRTQRRFPEAARLFRRAISISLYTEEARSAAQAILGLALLEQDRGQPELALRLLERAGRLVDPGEDAHLHACIRAATGLPRTRVTAK